MSDTVTEEKTEVKDYVKSPKGVVLWDDDFNTFDHVINCLMKICNMDYESALTHTMNVHNKGKSLVANGDDKKIKMIKVQLMAEGLTATIEEV